MVSVPGRLPVTVGEECGLSRIVLENEYLRLTVLPELGAKISSLVRLESGREFLLQPPDRPLRPACYGAAFESFDTSGYDDCFPNISACEIETKNGTLQLPDHGELWPVGWEVEKADDEIFARIGGVAVPYNFTKRIRLDGEALQVQYSATNLSEEALPFIWSAHPLLSIEDDYRILLPKEVKSLFVNFSYRDRLGSYGDECAWPITTAASGEQVDLSVPPRNEVPSAVKLFTHILSEGTCGIYYPQTDETLSFKFDPEKVPYIGVWLCHGGWPNEERAHRTIALEPCSGRPDSLKEAIATQQCRSIAPGATEEWDLRLDVRSGLVGCGE